MYHHDFRLQMQCDHCCSRNAAPSVPHCLGTHWAHWRAQLRSFACAHTLAQGYLHNFASNTPAAVQPLSRCDCRTETLFALSYLSPSAAHYIAPYPSHSLADGRFTKPKLLALVHERVVGRGSRTAASELHLSWVLCVTSLVWRGYPASVP